MNALFFMEPGKLAQKLSMPLSKDSISGVLAKAVCLEKAHILLTGWNIHTIMHTNFQMVSFRCFWQESVLVYLHI